MDLVQDNEFHLCYTGTVPNSNKSHLDFVITSSFQNGMIKVISISYEWKGKISVKNRIEGGILDNISKFASKYSNMQVIDVLNEYMSSNDIKLEGSHLNNFLLWSGAFVIANDLLINHNILSIIPVTFTIPVDNINSGEIFTTSYSEYLYIPTQAILYKPWMEIERTLFYIISIWNNIWSGLYPRGVEYDINMISLQTIHSITNLYLEQSSLKQHYENMERMSSIINDLNDRVRVLETEVINMKEKQ